MLECPEDDINLYALDAHTIGLSNHPPSLWLDNRLWEAKAKVIKDASEHELTILLPSEIVRFYRPKKIELAASPEKDNILLIIHQ